MWTVAIKAPLIALTEKGDHLYAFIGKAFIYTNVYSLLFEYVSIGRDFE